MVNREAEFQAFGFDIDREAVMLSVENAKKAGVKSKIRIDAADIADFKPTPGSIVICNPPYGERMLDIREAEQLYTIMGKVMNPSAENPCYITLSLIHI